MDRSGELKIGLLARWPVLVDQVAAHVHIRCKSQLGHVPSARLVHAMSEPLGTGDRASNPDRIRRDLASPY